MVEEDQLSFGVASGRTARFLEEHEPEETHHLRPREEIEEQAAQTDRFEAQGGGGRVARVARVEDQIDDVQHGAQPRRQVLRLGHLVGKRLRADHGLCANDALRERRRRDEERLRDLLRRQPAHLTQGERDLRLGRKRGMTAGEDEPKTVVLHLVDGPGLFVGARLERDHEAGVRRARASATADDVDGLEATRRQEPGTRLVRNAGLGPRLERGRKGLVHGLFGEFEVAAEPADQRGQDSARVRPVESVDDATQIRARHRRQPELRGHRRGGEAWRRSRIASTCRPVPAREGELVVARVARVTLVTPGDRPDALGQTRWSGCSPQRPTIWSEWPGSWSTPRERGDGAPGGLRRANIEQQPPDLAGHPAPGLLQQLLG